MGANIVNGASRVPGVARAGMALRQKCLALHLGAPHSHLAPRGAHRVRV